MKFLNEKFLKDLYFRTTGKIKNKKFKCKDFTIISNNCFGGVVYRNNAMEYKSPTCGLFFMAEDYIKFIYNLDHYLSIDDISQISLEESKHKEYLKEINYTGIIGKLDDIEIMFLHYPTIEEAANKWNRRKKRINKDNIIFKFSDQNLCTLEHLKKFEEFNAKNKICFTAKKYDGINSIQFTQDSGCDYVVNDAKEKEFKKYFNIYEYVNSHCS